MHIYIYIYTYIHTYTYTCNSNHNNYITCINTSYQRTQGDGAGRAAPASPWHVIARMALTARGSPRK